ncbi:hypothetical protein GCM10025864_08750 [Luteimicrobium album]|uniref:Uncharacterized protein n=1 Tax=Luteimicrobium album TaxID=1054550 RepID=A0ABQ6HYM8_9MICO|nr:hypothetical protein GCM10025864_08750 [Luteimicrobium album]
MVEGTNTGFKDEMPDIEVIIDRPVRGPVRKEALLPIVRGMEFCGWSHIKIRPRRSDWRMCDELGENAERLVTVDNRHAHERIDFSQSSDRDVGGSTRSATSEGPLVAVRARHAQQGVAAPT